MRVKIAPVIPEGKDEISLRSNLFNKDGISKWSLSQARRELQRDHASQSQDVTSQDVGNQSKETGTQNITVLLGTPEPDT
jgi:hypothetical protein